MHASAAKTIARAAAHVALKSGGPPAASAHEPTYDASTLPTRPIATVVPTPVPRIDVGNTCAASAYIVACTAFMSAPVTAKITIVLANACALGGRAAITNDAPIASPVITSSASRDPNR